MSRIQTLRIRAQIQRFDDPTSHLLEKQRTPITGDQLGPKVVQRLLAAMSLARLQPQRDVPAQIKLQRCQGFLVRQIKHLLEDQHPHHRRHRLVRPAVVSAVQIRERPFIDPRQRRIPKRPGPRPIQPGLFLRR